jgi:hypothetical protein
MSGLNIVNPLRYRNLLVVIKQTAYEEYSSVRFVSKLCCRNSNAVSIDDPQMQCQKHAKHFTLPLTLQNLT